MRRPLVIPLQDPTHPSVVFYCPDTHVVYDGRTPTERGIGGGVTARVRMARALARRGHRVTMVVNCPTHETLDDVEYVPLATASRLSGDVVILHTSGGGLDLSPALGLTIEAGLRIAWTSGPEKPKGVESLRVDVIYPNSAFINRAARDKWDMPRVPRFTSYNSFDEDLFRKAEGDRPRRDPFRLIYLSHPSKGWSSALSVLRRLRQSDPRFVLHVFGGDELWGGEGGAPAREAGLVWHGLVGQRELATELLSSSFALHLQDRHEPFGMALIESMRAGCVVLASAVGAYPELIRQGVDGLLIDGPSSSDATIATATQHVMEFTNDDSRRMRMAAEAARVPWSTETMADVWRGHWEWSFDSGEVAASECPVCGASKLRLADGDHCTSCGEYSRDLAGARAPVQESAILAQ